MSAVLTQAFSSCAGKLEETREAIKRDHELTKKRRAELMRTFDDDVKKVVRERAELLGIVEEQETKVKNSARVFEEVQARKELLKREHDEAVKRYVKMSDTVAFIQEGDRRLKERTDYEGVLEQENAAWAERERQLLATVAANNDTLRQARKERQKEIEALEGELKEAMRRLEQEREARRENSQRETPLLCRGPRGSSHPPSQRPTVPAVHTQAPDTMEVNHKEQQFIAVNKSSGVPTRQIRSCLKGGNTAGGHCSSHELEAHKSGTGLRRRSVNGGRPNGQVVSQHSRSAPVSRATSNSVVSGEAENIAKPPVAGCQRAFSCVDPKRVAGRKHELLRDSTNY